MNTNSLSAAGFSAVSDFFFQHSGIRLKPEKMSLVVSRLSRRATALNSPSLDHYIQHVIAHPTSPEAVLVVDTLTTNETYFFREQAHFDHLAKICRHHPHGRDGFRVWSAAASSGEEAYSIAMTLARHAGTRPWKVIGTDLSTKIVAQAKQGLYVAERCSRISPEDLKRWCWRGEGQYQGMVLMDKELRAKVQFETGNLLHAMPQLGQFDVIFLRNVLIYFEGANKAQLVNHVIDRLRDGGYLYTGHAESLHGLEHSLRRIAPAVFQRVN